ncbi:MAG: glycoside hydrolase family 2 protein [Candidatus Acidiferrales bacterium]
MNPMWKRAARFVCVALFLSIPAVIPASLSAQAKSGSAAMRERTPLDKGWEFRQSATSPTTTASAAAAPIADAATWRPADVPGCVHTDLLRNKLIPDPFYRDNETKLQWIENADWEYRNTIDATPALLARKNVELVFEGLDTYADVYVNEKLALSADNMFREWRVDLKPLLKSGPNTLRIVFHSVFPEAQKAIAADRWASLTHEEDKNYVRKAAYEYGWDWGPRFVTAGMWRPVYIESWDSARISDLYVEQSNVSKAEAALNAQVEVTASAAGQARVEVSYSEGGKTQSFAQMATLQPGVNKVVVPIEIQNPDLWYPNGYGPQTLYDFRASLIFDHATVDSAHVRTGLRSIVLKRDYDQWGRSFEFVVNGIPIFAKGSDIIPFDSFPARVTTEQYRQVLQAAHDTHMNIIRQWGGGYYETQEFYDLCDQLGIMVWQDFQFATPIPWSINDNVRQEAIYQVRRLRNHPSLAIWVGNNELEWFFSGAQSPLLALPQEGRERMWQEYMALFSGILPATVAKLDSETPYWPASPSADYEWPPNSDQSGDVHDWEVWHGIASNRGALAGSVAGPPATVYEQVHARFMSEYGFQSFPEMSTIDSFTLPEDRGVMTPVMDSHQKNHNVNGNLKIHDYMQRDYPEPKNFAAFVYMSQVQQADVVKIGAEHLRRSRPRTMGSIFWQLNDCWPVVSWASVDYFGRWKALQYYAARFYNDILVSPHQENGSVAVYVVSDRMASATGNLRVRVMTFDGTVLDEKSQAVQIAPLSSAVALELPMEEFLHSSGFDPTKAFLDAELTVDGKVVSSNVLLFSAVKDLALPVPEIKSEIVQQGDSYRVRLTSNVFARDVYASVADADPDAKYSDNYFDLLPGQSAEIELKSKATLEQLRAALKVVSLADESKHAAAATTP